MSEFESKMREFLDERYGLDGGSLTADSALFSDGLLDSFAMVELVAFVEAESGAKVKAKDLTLENFDSIARIMAFLAR